MENTEATVQEAQETQETQAQDNGSINLLKEMLGEPIEDTTTQPIETVDNTVTQEDETVSDKEEVIEEQEGEFYTEEELANWDYESNGEINVNKIPPHLMPIYKVFQKDYTKKTQALATEKKSFEEELANFRQKQQELLQKEEATQTGLSNETLGNIDKEVQDIFANQLEMEFNPQDENHKALYEKLKAQATHYYQMEQAKTDCEERVANTLINELGYQKAMELEYQVMDAVNNLPKRDFDTLVQARQQGNFDVILAFYRQVQAQQTNQTKEPVMKQEVKQQSTAKRVPPNNTLGNKQAIQPEQKKVKELPLSNFI